MAQRNRQPRIPDIARPTEPEAPPVVEQAVEAPVVSAPPPAHERLVRIRNLTGQMIQCSVRSASGVSEALALDARTSSQPYPESAIDDYTNSLVARGFLKIETAR
jgi:hypothetical protein